MDEAFVSIGAGAHQVPLIEAGKALGYAIVAVDQNPKAPGAALANEHIVATTYESVGAIRQIHDLASRYAFVGVLARASGPAVVCASEVAEALGLAGIPLKVAHMAMDKARLHKGAVKLGIRTFTSKTVSPSVRNWGFDPKNGPVVVKPRMPKHGKVGVRLVKEEALFEQALEHAAADSFDSRVEVQPFVAGMDIGVLAVCHRGTLTPVVSIDELVINRGRRFEGLGLSVPSAFRGRRVESMVHEALTKLAPLFAEASCHLLASFRVPADGSRPLLYELNPGLGGDGLADLLLPALWPGTDPFVYDVRLAMGKKPVWPDTQPAPAALAGGALIQKGSIRENLDHVAAQRSSTRPFILDGLKELTEE